MHDLADSFPLSSTLSQCYFKLHARYIPLQSLDVMWPVLKVVLAMASACHCLKLPGRIPGEAGSDYPSMLPAGGLWWRILRISSGKDERETGRRVANLTVPKVESSDLTLVGTRHLLCRNGWHNAIHIISAECCEDIRRPCILTVAAVYDRRLSRINHIRRS